MNPKSGTDFQDWEQVILTKKNVNSKDKSNNSSNNKKNEDIITINKSNGDLRKALQNARLNKKMSQKEVAQKLNVKANLIMDYESGKTAPNNSFISKLEKLYNTKLPRVTKSKINTN